MPIDEKTWILASNNTGKIAEFNSLLASKDITLKQQSSFNVSDADETASTFIENALIKARHAADLAKLPALADDSGLVVPSLNGEPGIFSARYAGTRDANDNIQKLLKNIQQLCPDDNNISMPAYFYCVIVLLQHADDPSPLVSEGRWLGQITLEPKGENGFGYDPVFFDPKLKITAAQMSAEQKQSRSHRGQAMRKLLSNLDNLNE